jgi:hypothetical protein
LYKIAQGYNLLICNELFNVGRSIVSVVFKEIIIGINIVFNKVLFWPIGNKIQTIMQGFKSFCGLPNIQGAINGKHFSISKLVGPFSEDFFITKQAVITLCVKLFKMTKNCLLICSLDSLGVSMTPRFLENLYFMLMLNNKDFLVQNKNQDGFVPYLLGDKGYPLLSLLMTSHRDGETNILEMFYNKKHR